MELKITDGLWISDMRQIPYRPMFEAVLTVNEIPGVVDDMIKHRHVEFFDNDDPQTGALIAAVDWVQELWEAGKDVLVRSEHGINRPQYVVIALFVQMGADTDEAIGSVTRRVEYPLQNDTFLDALQQW